GPVDGDPQVHVVTADAAVDEVLRHRKDRGPGERGVDLRTDVGERTQRRFQVLEVGDQALLGVVHQTRYRVAEFAELAQGGGEVGALGEQHVERGRDSVQR